MGKNIYRYTSSDLCQLKVDLVSYAKSIGAEYEETTEEQKWALAIKRPSPIPLASTAIIVAINCIADDLCEVVLANGKWGGKLAVTLFVLFSPLTLIPTLIILPFGGNGMLKQGSLERQINTLVKLRLQKT